MCNNGAKDNLGQVADFIWLAIGATVCECPHPGTAAMNHRAASGGYFNVGEYECGRCWGLRVDLMRASSNQSTIRSFGMQSLVLAAFGRKNAVRLNNQRE